MSDLSPAVSLEDRRARLLQAINWYQALGYRVVSQTDTTAQLVRPKRFSCLLASLTFLCFGIGIIFYLFIYMAMRDSTMYIVVDDDGIVSYNGRVPASRSDRPPSSLSVQFREMVQGFSGTTVGTRLIGLWDSGIGGRLSIAISVGTVVFMCVLFAAVSVLAQRVQ